MTEGSFLTSEFFCCALNSNKAQGINFCEFSHDFSTVAMVGASDMTKQLDCNIFTHWNPADPSWKPPESVFVHVGFSRHKLQNNINNTRGKKKKKMTASILFVFLQPTLVLPTGQTIDCWFWNSTHLFIQPVVETCTGHPVCLLSGTNKWQKIQRLPPTVFFFFTGQRSEFPSSTATLKRLWARWNLITTLAIDLQHSTDPASGCHVNKHSVASWRSDRENKIARNKVVFFFALQNIFYHFFSLSLSMSLATCNWQLSPAKTHH